MRGYTDSDYAGDRDNIKATSVCMFIYVILV